MPSSKSIPFLPFRIIVVLLLGMFTSNASAQKTIINGRVYDAETKESIPFVNIAFKDSKIGTTTDLDGNFRLETYYATDSILASAVGYKLMAKKVKADKEQTIDFLLDPGTFKLNEVVINAKDFENPAHIILRRIIANKPVNNKAKLGAYQFETYNKIQFDLNNLSEKFTNRKIFKDFDFIFERIDSTKSKVALPFFMTETLSDFYFRRDPKGRKEIIHATKVSGIENESISQFLGQMYQDVNVYENSISIFGKNFVSPISNYGLVFYKYALVDSMFIDNKWCYRLDYTPKNENELVFTGHLWVNDTTYAVKEVDAQILRSANINFITDLKVLHKYDEVEREVWMLSSEELIADFTVVEGEMGFYAKRSASYRNFKINEPKDPEFYSGANAVIVESQVNEESEDYWRDVRHEEITENQQAIYDMVDSLKANPVFMTYIDVVNFLIQGYRVHGKVEIGPVFTFLSYNDVEGFRPKFGLRTSNDFSTRLLLEGYLAYGIRDERFKYMLGAQYFLSKKPRQIIGAYYSEDLELIGQIPNFFPRDHWVQTFTSRNPQNRLILNRQARIFTSREWFTGFSTKMEFKHRVLAAKGDWAFERQQTLGIDGQVVDIKTVTTSEVSLGVRFAFRERFVTGEFERVSLGSLWPILEANLDLGVSGVFGSEYAYQKLTAKVSDKIPVGPFGNTYYTIEAGKTWQALPYVLQFVHPGSESIFYNDQAFNTMNYFEFVSDQYVSMRAEHHFEGLLFNKIPLFQKLKWRELIGINGIYGSFDEANRDQLLLPDLTFAFGDKPFAEAYVGVENIFKFIRIDAIWRLTYLDNPRTQKFGVLIGFDIQF